ncbi:MAG: ABC transporter substrate-binding protein [Clostridiales bacterium]|nr:ABC transporter substrate-binding protein [Clostridiales bacterium]
MKKMNLFKKCVALACVTSMILTGCGKKADDNNSGATENPAPTESASNEMITITDAKGEVQIPANPKRIVDISGNSDILSILGYSVIGTANSDAYDYTRFPSYLEEVLYGAEILGYSMQDTMDIEGILALEPDLIIISSTHEKMYEQLKEIAPTVMIQLAQTDWKEDVMNVANVMNKTEQAEQWLAQYKETAAKMGEKVKETYGEDTTYLTFLASGGSIFVFDKAGIGSVLYEDMGLARPAGLPEQQDISLPVVTYEGLAAIDADVIFAVGTEEDFAQLKASPIYNSMPAVKNGKVVELPCSPYFNIGYSSIGRSIFVNEVMDLMEKINE